MAVFNNNSMAVNNSVLPAERLTERLVESILAVYIMPLIIAVGTMGNLTSLAVLLRRRMRRTSVYLYLTVLALADVGVLYVSAFKTWIRLVRKCTWSFSFSLDPKARFPLAELSGRQLG